MQLRVSFSMNAAGYELRFLISLENLQNDLKPMCRQNVFSLLMTALIKELENYSYLFELVSHMVKTGFMHINTILNRKNGVLQGSVLDPIPFVIYSNNLCENAKEEKFHSNADLTIFYPSGSSVLGRAE